MAFAAGLALATNASAAAKLEVETTYISQDVERLAPQSLLDPIQIPNEGFAGAEVGQADNQTTGGFLGRDYKLTEVNGPVDGDLIAETKATLDAGSTLLVVDGPAEQLLAIADLPEAAEAIVFNIGTEDDRLRTDECRLIFPISFRAVR